MDKRYVIVAGVNGARKYAVQCSSECGEGV